MTRKNLFLFLIFIFTKSFVYSAAYKSDFGVFTSGFSTSSAKSPSFINTSSIGQNGTENMQSFTYRSYSGYMPVSMAVQDIIFSFMDESPSSADWQCSTPITAKITIEAASGNAVTAVKYRISTSGAEESSFSAWMTDASTDTIISATKAVYKTSISSFSESENNYIQWKALNAGGYSAVSGKYRIRVRSNDVPVITIIQPDEKGGITTANPLIQARVSDQYYGIDENSIEIKIDYKDGSNAALITSASKNDIYISSQSLISYKYDKTPLSAGSTYKLTVSVSDKKGLKGSSSMLFTSKSGLIADLVPYPSPFDPKIQPIMIRYVLNKRSEVSINIYDMSGRLMINVINNQWREAGVSEDPWKGVNYADDDLANGVYFCEIIAKNDEGEQRRYTSLAIFGK